MRDLERAVRTFLSILGWVRALSKGGGAVARRGARIATARGSVRALDRTMGWRR